MTATGTCPPIGVATIPPVGRAEAEVLATAEYDRFLGLLRSLDAADWSAPTECALWDVRAMAGHLVGEICDFSSLRSVVRRMRAVRTAVKRSGVPMVDTMTALQVADNDALTTAELVARAEQHMPIAARWRTHAPWWLRRMPFKVSNGGPAETWRLSYLLDTILTRDPWMHRVDITRATGRELVLTADHDGRIVADVVAEWARRHGAPFDLTLTGPAGGRYVAGVATAGEQITLDAVEFCRMLSGRAPGSGLLAHEVPF